MGILREFEKRLESLVEGFFARALPGGGIQPVELGKAMVRTMEENRTGGTNRTVVPNAFTFRLSTRDFERLRDLERDLVHELRAVARRAAAQEGWRLAGPPRITLDPTAEQKRGTFTVTARALPAEEPEPAAGPQTQLIQMHLEADAELVRVGGRGRAWPLSKDTLVIGRLDTCDVQIHDAAVSRRHAEVRREGDEWVLIDLGSTNGTDVNGAPVNRHRLEPGDRLTFGDTILEFRRPS